MGQVRALKHLGEAHRAAGSPDQARESLASARMLFNNLEAAQKPTTGVQLA